MLFVINLTALISTLLAFIRWMPQAIRLHKNSCFKGVNINLFLLICCASVLVATNQLLTDAPNRLLIAQVGAQFLFAFFIVLRYFFAIKEKWLSITARLLFFLAVPFLIIQTGYISSLSLSTFAGAYFIGCWWCQLWTVLVKPILRTNRLLLKDIKESFQSMNLDGISLPSFIISCCCMLCMIPNLLMIKADTVLFLSYVNGAICSFIIVLITSRLRMIRAKAARQQASLSA